MWIKIVKILSQDHKVSKFVFTKSDAIAESVLYKYPTYEDRTVICCSTMSGCPIGCRFCGAGDYFARSLTSEEIVSQTTYLLESIGVEACKIQKLQIMFMSMGEPMLNLIELEKALKILNAKYPHASLLVSTSAPKADYAHFTRISKEINTIGLQFSVHESTNEARNKLIPYKRKMSLQEISEVGANWFKETGRQPFFNYCVHENNNKIEDVERLLGLFHPDIWQCTLSVICERDEHIAAANERQKNLVEEFMQNMMKAGFSTRMFNPAGQDDIGGGCGQLWYVQDWMKNNSDKVTKSIGHGKDKVHTPK
jgi:23S rRNA (adenine2503-C2)-methyltransferase